MSMIRNDITKVKKANIELIKAVLKTNPESTKAQIAELAGVSVVTCGKILNKLKTTGEVLEGAHINTGCGRPATTYRFNAGFEAVACLFLWSDCGQLELVCEIADMIGQTTFSTVQSLGNVDYPMLEETVRTLLAQDASIRAVVVGVPGTIVRGVISCSYLLPLNGIALQQRLSAAFPSVQIIVENAARAAAYGYCVSEQPTAGAPICYCFIPAEVCTGRTPREILTHTAFTDNFPPFGKPLLIDVGLACDHAIIRGFSGFAGSLGTFLPPDLFDDIPAEMLASLFQMLIPVLNPSVIAVTGSGVSPVKLGKIRTLCADFFAAEHLPQLVSRSDCRMDYARGLILIGLQACSSRLELVRRQI